MMFFHLSNGIENCGTCFQKKPKASVAAVDVSLNKVAWAWARSERFWLIHSFMPKKSFKDFKIAKSFLGNTKEKNQNTSDRTRTQITGAKAGWPNITSEH